MKRTPLYEKHIGLKANIEKENIAGFAGDKKGAEECASFGIQIVWY